MRRICLIRQYYFPHDPRVRREVEALTARGHAVEVICMRRPAERRLERNGPVTIRRLLMRHRSGRLSWMLEYVLFMILAGLVAGALCLRRRFDLVQVNTIPDTLVFAALIPKLMGVPVLIDLHECMPEFFASSFGVSLTHPAVRAIAAFEQASIRFADFALTCTEEMREAFVLRGAPPDKIAVVMNSSDERIFTANDRTVRPRATDGFQLVYHGTIEPRYGVDTAIRAVAALRDELPDLRLMIYGEGSYRNELVQLTLALGLEREVSFSDGFVPLPELVDAIAACDAGVVAIKRDAFRDLTHCNKMFDLISMHRPVLCSRTRSVMSHFPDDCFAYFEPDDHEDLARAIRTLHMHPAQSKQLVQRAKQINEPYRWPRQRERYLRIAEAVAAQSTRRNL